MKIESHEMPRFRFSTTSNTDAHYYDVERSISEAVAL
jgi:hypothetical protein